MRFSTLHTGTKSGFSDFLYVSSNHLGNVLTVVSDRKITVDNNADNVVDYYNADIISSTDYYAFGSPMPGRSFNSNQYRYSINGQEKTDEISGNGNHTTAMFWEYDTRLGRRWNLDPKSTIGVSDYACFLNNPIKYADPDGDKVRFDNAKTFFKVIGKAITDKGFRQQLIAQAKATRTSTSTRQNRDGSTTTIDNEQSLYIKYSYNKQSNTDLQTAANNIDNTISNDDAANVSANQNNYFQNFSDKSETIKSMGVGGPGIENQGPKEVRSKQLYNSGTITIDRAGSNRGTADRMTVFHGATQLRTMLLPVTAEDGSGGIISGIVIPFNSSKSAMIRVVFSNDDNKVNDPGAYGATINIARP